MVTDVLARTHYHESQTKLDRQGRNDNVEDAFVLLDADRLAHKRILLIDDVITTGATMCAAAQCLQQIEDLKITAATLTCVVEE